MKKLLLFSMLICSALSYSSPRCLDHQASKYRSPLRKGPLEHVECSCPCQNYPRSHHADGYKCLVCDHRLLPSQIESPTEQTSDNLTPVADAFVASALLASIKNLYDESNQPKPAATPPANTQESWMVF